MMTFSSLCYTSRLGWSVADDEFIGCFVVPTHIEMPALNSRSHVQSSENLYYVTTVSTSMDIAAYHTLTSLNVETLTIVPHGPVNILPYPVVLVTTPSHMII